ncbi:MAG: hypothetical protein ACRCXT_11140 [Paraclostridium sp.]
MKSEFAKELETELINIKRNLRYMDAWQTEIEVIESKINAYKGDNLGFKSGGKTFDLNSIIESEESRLEYLKSKIDYTEYKITKIEAYMQILEKEEREIIYTKYLDKEIKKISFEALGAIIKSSGSTASRIHREAIQKMAEYKNDASMIKI